MLHAEKESHPIRVLSLNGASEERSESKGHVETEVTVRIRQREKSGDALKNRASDISQGESEDKCFFFLAFCRFLGRAAPL